jgi:transcription initiation factor TFIIB
MSETPSPDADSDSRPTPWRSFSATQPDTLESAADNTQASGRASLPDDAPVDRRPGSQETAFETLAAGPTRADRHDRGLGSKLYGGSHSDQMDDLQAGGITPRREQVQRYVDLHASGGRPLQYLLADVCRIASALELSDPVRERACELCHELEGTETATWQPYAFETWAGAAVYTAGREQNQYVPLEEVVAKVKATGDGEDAGQESDLRACYVRFQDTLDLAIPPVHPSDELARLRTAVDQPVTSDVVETATAVITAYLDAGNTGAPAGIAAAALLAAVADVHELDRDSQLALRRRLQDRGGVAQRTITRHYEAFPATPDRIGGPEGEAAATPMA